jgi:hypothetical protein
MPWDITGNSGTDPATDFLGTSDNQPLVIRTNGAEALRIDGSGSVGIGTTNPNAGLHVSGTGGKGIILIEREGKSLALNPNWAGRNEFARITTVQGSNMGLQLDTNEVPKLTITVGGDVGIGTTAPQEKLHVDGNVLVTGDITLSGADCAENFDVEEAQSLEPGMVMVIGDEEKVYQCTQAYDKRVAGVISGAGDYKPGMILGNNQSQNKRLPVALTGKVYCKVDTQYAPIAVGDLLTTSPSPGHAMKASDPLKAFGAILGKALRPLKEGQGLIPVLIALQ